MEYELLIGFEITAFDLVEDDDELWPTFTLKNHQTDQVLQIEVSRDPEGNAPGHLFIGEV